MGVLQLDHKCALVTGAGSGIGAAIARRLAADGARVVIGDYDLTGARAVAAELKSAGGEATACAMDVTVPQSVEAAVEFAVRTYGALHLAVNNAGISAPMVPTADLAVEDWRRVIDTNLNGVFYGLKYEIPAILAAGGGAIVNTGSMFSAVGRTDFAAYVAAKHGVLGLTKTAAQEYAAQGLRVNAVGPGFIHTPLIAGLEADAATNAMLVSLHPIGRLGRPEEVAELTLWLSSPAASFVTGAYVPVDGGYLTR